MVNFTKVSGKNIGDVKLFALSTCVWCRKAKAFLNDRGIGYSYVDVDLLTEAEADEVKNKWGKYTWSYPTIAVNESETINGYNLEALKRLAGEQDGSTEA